MIQIGTKIEYMPWSGKNKTASISDIQLCEDVHEKYGETVDRVEENRKHLCSFGLDDGHWCYGGNYSAIDIPPVVLVECVI